MHAMYSEKAAEDIYDLISDDTIDLNQFARMCDPYCHFYSDISTAEFYSSKFTENKNVPGIHNKAQTLANIVNTQPNTLPSKAGSSCRDVCALEAGNISPKSGPMEGRFEEAENQPSQWGPHGPVTTSQAAPNPIPNAYGVGTGESEGIHMNTDHITLNTKPSIFKKVRFGDSSPYMPHLCKAPKSGSVGSHPSPDGLHECTNVKADVAPRGLGVLHKNIKPLAINTNPKQVEGFGLFPPLSPSDMAEYAGPTFQHAAGAKGDEDNASRVRKARCSEAACESSRIRRVGQCS